MAEVHERSKNNPEELTTTDRREKGKKDEKGCRFLTRISGTEKRRGGSRLFGGRRYRATLYVMIAVEYELERSQLQLRNLWGEGIAVGNFFRICCCSDGNSAGRFVATLS